MRRTLALVLLGLIALTPPCAAHPEHVPTHSAQAIADDAYIYFYPLVTMELTRRQLTNVHAGKSEIGGPMNTFINLKALPSAELRAVVRPNFDTLLSSGWLDLTHEPMVVSVPDTGGRYYLLPMLDMWTDVFASPGWRTTGTRAATFLVTPPGWDQSPRQAIVEKYRLPLDIQRIDAPTPYVWVLGRTKTDGPSDYEAVHRIQAGYKITPLSEWGKEPSPVAATFDPSVDIKTPPKLQVDNMTGSTFFTYAAELLKFHPPHITDQPILAKMRHIGIDREKPFDFAKLDPTIQRALENAPKNAQRLMAWKLPILARVENGWSMNTDTMGVYGNYYLKRAIVAQLALSSNLPEDAIYPLNLADDTGQPLDGANKYTIHFAKGETPPVSAFWSITLYDTQGFQVANSLNRFAISSWMPLVINPDNSLDLYIQNESPGPGKDANWLPAPKGPFTLTMRLYAPDSTVLTGEWNPPPVVNANLPADGASSVER